ncbi:C-glycoside deglycosidase beta subunit domain-containing protein [Kineococcus auxinigenes]|uniref:C-glycoside deglycosidase beta subunit domain-containing protein n=1 Tax=unclassified Kineococcus TaxID=2621656 RepID=UPI003D7C5A17
MFEKYVIVRDTLRNVVEGGRTTGYEVGVRMPYYRGLGLSMVEDVSVTVDGLRAAPERTTFTVHGNSYPLTELGEVVDDRWELGEVATVRVAHPGGLAPGVHDVEVSQRLRISYMPVPGGGRARAEVELSA